MSNLFITNVKTILTAPGGIDLVVVKIETNEPGLYGLAAPPSRNASMPCKVPLTSTLPRF